MRLHTLTVRAFGPFAGTEHVDFDTLADSGLFLFSGPTGAGKTSVLDAACFAIYGQVPGARQGAHSLRSDHAAEGVAPEVVLELTVRGRRLRITRSPAWDRPKRRGSGSTTEQARVLVQERAADGWVTQSTRLDEAGQLLTAVVGLTCAQFCQVVLLPQGQFADFLRADPDRRRALLETLFDTRRFAAVESWLVARRQETWRALSAADAETGQVLARVSQAAGVPLPENLDLEHGPSWTADLLRQSVEATCALEAALTRARSELREAISALQIAHQVVQRRERRGRLEARQAELELQAETHKLLGAELDAAQRVAPLVPLVEHRDELATTLLELQARIEAGETSVAASLTHLAGLGATAELSRSAGLAATGTDGASRSRWSPDDVAAAARASRDELVRLRVIVDHETRVAGLEGEVDGLAQSLVALASRTRRLHQLVADADAERSRLVTTRDAAAVVVAGAEAARARRQSASAWVEAARERDRLRVELTDLEERLRTIVDRHQVAREAEQQIREARLAGMAAELAAALEDDVHCPVCGSPSHPRPAPTSGRVDPADEEAAALRTREAETLRRDAEQAKTALEANLVHARESAGGDAAADDLAAELDAAEQALAAIEESAAFLARCEARLRELDETVESARRDEVGLAQESARIQAQQSALRQRADELAAAVADARGDDPSVAARVARLQRQSSELDDLASLLAEGEHLRAALAQAHSRLSSALDECGLEDASEVLASRRDMAHIAQLRRRTEAYQAECSAVREQLAEPELVTADADDEPPLTDLGEVVESAQARTDALTGDLAAARSRRDSLRELREDLDSALRRRAPLAEAHQVADRLSRLAEGKSTDNRLRMSLSAYVLAARLEQVADAATQRLLRMSSGRFSLVHASDAGSGRGRGGLALRVLDSWTGRERDPATLSGGETFSASLSLALGLADVVTAEAGGAVLETLFVDEGFGSLDDETLDEVMGVLDDLREGGRTVGIVSHVADLRQRVPTQLRIVKGRQGSTIAGPAVAADGTGGA